MTGSTALEQGKQNGRNIVTKVFANSAIRNGEADYPKFDKPELKMGKVLGKGGFGTVFEIRSFSLDGVKVTLNQKGFEDDLDETQYDIGSGEELQKEARIFIAKHCLRNNSDARYAVKMLSPEVVANPGTCIQGMMDMALETRFLSDLEHPNIIKMRGMASCDPFTEGYFILMDRLYDTLERRIQKVWLPKSKRHAGFFGKTLLDRKGVKKDALFEERIVYAFDLAAAINYLHRRKILYRDLKPENIGFDCRDDIKLFDFGLSKELRDDLACGDGLYNLTADTGSPRYMAPEVALGQPYNGTCDTYSFALVLWQMLALSTPFEVYTIKRLKERVWGGIHYRPQVPDDWSGNVKLLLKRGWSQEVKERFTMEQVENILKKECTRVRDGNSDGLEHQRRRSTFVFRDKKTTAETNAIRKSVIMKANGGAMPTKGKDSAAFRREDPMAVSERDARVLSTPRKVKMSQTLDTIQSEHDPRVISYVRDNVVSCDV